MKGAVVIRVKESGHRRIITPRHKNFWESFKANAKLDTDYYLEIRPVRKDRRSLPQNAFWFGIVVPFFQRCMLERGDAMSMQYAHEVLKHYFIPMVQAPGERAKTMPDGSIVAMPPSTTMLTRAQFSDMLEIVRAMFAEWFDGETFAWPDSDMVSQELENEKKNG